MQENQYRFEVVRDLATMLGKLKPGENIAITVTRHVGNNTDLFSWNTSNGTTYGCSETSRAMRDAYNKPVER